MKAKELKPGELFSAVGPEWWDHFDEYAPGAVGQKVYIRTAEPCPSDQAEDLVYRIEIEVTEDEEQAQ